MEPVMKLCYDINKVAEFACINAYNKRDNEKVKKGLQFVQDKLEFLTEKLNSNINPNGYATVIMTIKLLKWHEHLLRDLETNLTTAARPASLQGLHADNKTTAIDESLAEVELESILQDADKLIINQLLRFLNVARIAFIEKAQKALANDENIKFSAFVSGKFVNRYEDYEDINGFLTKDFVVSSSLTIDLTEAFNTNIRDQLIRELDEFHKKTPWCLIQVLKLDLNFTKC